jgi:hypothetical protein
MERELDGQDFKRALIAAKLQLEQHMEEINSLNVFPVPDGDTGLNMFLTMEAAVEAVIDKEDTSVATIATSAGKGALMGARGNSGIILSQILRGMADGIGERKTLSASALAGALHSASEKAYKTVREPVEGTILTAIRAASEAASEAAGKGASFSRTVASIVSRVRTTVKKTPDMLPLLKETGVVDAGAKGLYYFFRGMENAICRNPAPPRSGKTAHASKNASPSAIKETFLP